MKFVHEWNLFAGGHVGKVSMTFNEQTFYSKVKVWVNFLDWSSLMTNKSFSNVEKLLKTRKNLSFSSHESRKISGTRLV